MTKENNKRELPKQLQAVALCASKHIPALLVGDPGIGKTAMVEALAEANGKKFIDVRLSAMQAEDLTGLPVYDTESKEVSFKLAKMFDPKTFEGNAILFFDEITSAGAEVLKGCLRILNERKFPNHEEKIPDDVWIIAACNPPSSGVDCEDLPPALANRFCWFAFDMPNSIWLEGMSKGFENIKYKPMDPKVLDVPRDTKAIPMFLKSNPQYIHKMSVTERGAGINAVEEMIQQSVFPSHRTWDWFARIAMSPLGGLIGPGLVGEQAYYAMIADKDLDITEYLEDPTTLKVDELPVDKVQRILLKASNSPEEDLDKALKLFLYVANTYGTIWTASRGIKLIKAFKKAGKRLPIDKLAQLAPRTKELV